MNERQSTPVTQLVDAVVRGEHAAEDLLPLMYSELRELARSHLAKLPPGQTIQPTALVHEAYLRLVGPVDPGWDGRGHFFAAAARAMRDILVERARRKAAVKHGGGRRHFSADDADLRLEPPAEDMVALNEALGRLEEKDPRKARIVDLRYFAGLNVEDTAAVLGISTATVKREWRFTRRWLFTQVSGPAPTDDAT